MIGYMVDNDTGQYAVGNYHGLCKGTGHLGQQELARCEEPWKKENADVALRAKRACAMKKRRNGVEDILVHVEKM